MNQCGPGAMLRSERRILRKGQNECMWQEEWVGKGQDLGTETLMSQSPLLIFLVFWYWYTPLGSLTWLSVRMQARSVRRLCCWLQLGLLCSEKTLSVEPGGRWEGRERRGGVTLCCSLWPLLGGDCSIFALICSSSFPSTLLQSRR